MFCLVSLSCTELQVNAADTFVFPLWRQRGRRQADYKQFVSEPLGKWETLAESVEIPLELFSGVCAEQDINFAGWVYDSFPDPGRKNPVNIRSDEIMLDSRVVTVRVSANKYDS